MVQSCGLLHSCLPALLRRSTCGISAAIPTLNQVLIRKQWSDTYVCICCTHWMQMVPIGGCSAAALPSNYGLGHPFAPSTPLRDADSFELRIS